jgi:hypothetical protein
MVKLLRTLRIHPALAGRCIKKDAWPGRPYADQCFLSSLLTVTRMCQTSPFSIGKKSHDVYRHHM